MSFPQAYFSFHEEMKPIIVGALPLLDSDGKSILSEAVKFHLINGAYFGQNIDPRVITTLTPHSD